MSAYSTLKITRKTAIEMLLRSLIETNDEMLETFIDKLIEPRLYNCQIVSDDCDNDDAEALGLSA